MQKFLVALGRFGSILLFTVVGLFVALIVTVGTAIITNINGGEISMQLALQVTAIVTVIGAVTLGSYITNLVFRAQELEKEAEKLKSYDTLTGLLAQRALVAPERSCVVFKDRLGKQRLGMNEVIRSPVKKL